MKQMLVQEHNLRLVKIGKIQSVKTQRAKTSENFAEEKMFAEDISEDFSYLTFTGIYSISGYLRNLRGRLLSSERVSEVFTLWVFTLKPFPAKIRSLEPGHQQPEWPPQPVECYYYLCFSPSTAIGRPLR